MVYKLPKDTVSRGTYSDIARLVGEGSQDQIDALKAFLEFMWAAGAEPARITLKVLLVAREETWDTNTFSESDKTEKDTTQTSTQCGENPGVGLGKD
jgi:hypothetical protein